jgi:hypothetical protein
LPIVTVTGPSYTFQSTDIGKVVSFTATGVITAHIPNPLGNAEDQLVVRLASSSGVVTIDGATGVTINAASQTVSQQWSEVVLIQETATNTWWIASAPKGATGATGASGATGATGPQGTQGSLGATGPQGTQGTQGSIGPQGTQGTMGTLGSQGSQGSAGTNGLINPVVASFGSQGSPAPNALTDNVYKLTMQDATANWKITGGTANDGQQLFIIITGTSGVSKNMTWPDATFGYTGMGTTLLPLSTVRGKVLLLQFQYDTGNNVNRWRIVNSRQT